jgi:hypothetical protein
MTRGFGLLCLGLDIATGQGPLNETAVRERFLRVERIWVAAEVLRSGTDSRFAGKRRARRLLAGVAHYPVDLPILDQQLTTGVWGTYRRSSSAFGLISGAGSRTVRLSETMLNASGRQLAATLRQHAGRGVQLGHWAAQASRTVPIPVLEQLAAHATPTNDEVLVLAQGMAAYDKAHELALCHLRSAYDHRGGLTLATINLGKLAPQQRLAVKVARSLVTAINAIERPFRHWVATGERSPIRSSAWSLDVWTAAESEGENDLIHLRNLAASRPAAKQLDAVLQHHRWLARSRGAPAWAPGDGREASFADEAPTFTLRAAASLFGEGVAPRAGA